MRDLSCGPATPVSSGPATLVTSAGSELELRRIGLGPLELRSDTGGVQLLFDGDVVSLTPEAGVVVDSLSFANGPALPFRGTAAIGVPVGAQGGAALLDGTYELREALGTRQRPELVGSGTLQAGDAVAIVEGLRSDATPRADVKGFLAPVDADQAGFRAVVSAFRPAAKEDGLRLEIARHGFAPTEIAPSWKDRVLADAFTYALVAIATVGLTGLTLLSQLRDLLRRPPGVAKNETAGTGNDAPASRMIGARGTATTGSQPEPAMTTASPHETPADWQSVRAGDAGPADTPKVMPADPSATVPRKAGEQTASTGDVSVPAHQPRPRSENA
ncbi:hypothetical protein [Roseibium alexandrii]|uniref:hypothetical protein n=1 Tax=Roseibium alexandrii TaxID=388408 RepID=UPI0011876820|nr:hypothetical protein [Roseibium alexandrii]